MNQDPPSSPNDKAQRIAILDVRPAAAFESGHHPAAVNIPLESLLARVHELPSPDTAMLIVDTCQVRARWAASRLRARGRAAVSTESRAAWFEAHGTTSGPGRLHLWRCHSLLAQTALPAMRRAWGSLAGKRALDLACGSGRDAVTMAAAGLDVEAWDRYDEALIRCRSLASQMDVSVTTRQVDVEREDALERASFDVIACFNFLHRPLMQKIAEAIRPGGFVVYETFTIEQRERFGKPSRDAHLLMPGELPDFFDGWERTAYTQGLAAPRRFVASLVARRPEDSR